MKKVLYSSILVVFAIAVLQSAVSCKKNDPVSFSPRITTEENLEEIKEKKGIDVFSKRGYRSTEEFAEQILEYYTGSEEQKEAIKNNEYIKTGIFGLGWDEARFSLGKIHNQGVEWNTIHELLLLFYTESELQVLPVYLEGLQLYVPYTYAEIHEHVLEKIHRDIRFEFKNPDSVKIYSARLFVLSSDLVIGDEKEGKYPSNYTMYAIVKCSAQNGFGGVVQGEVYVLFNGQKFVGMTTDLWKFTKYVQRVGTPSNEFCYLTNVECD